MQIRKAKLQDYEQITFYILLAMEDITLKFIGEKSHKKATLFLNAMTSEKDNQYSYENCWIIENKDGIIGVIW